MNKPLRGRRSGPLWALILLLVGGGAYGVWNSPLFVTETNPPAAAAPNSTPSLTAVDAGDRIAAPDEAPDLDFQQLVLDYRQAERAALQTLDATVLDQVPVFAHGEALASILQQVGALRSAGQYQILIVEDVQIAQVLPGDAIGVRVNERHSLQTFAQDPAGDRLLAQETNEYEVVYGFIRDNQRWKVDRVRIVN